MQEHWITQMAVWKFWFVGWLEFFLIFRFYNSLPPISKAFGTICVVATAAFHLGLYSPWSIALLYEPIFYNFQVKSNHEIYLGVFLLIFSCISFIIAVCWIISILWILMPRQIFTVVKIDFADSAVVPILKKKKNNLWIS